MYIPFPEHIPLDRAAIFAILLFTIQQLEGTALYFSVGSVAFILIGTLAFNIAGGLARASGAYIFFYSLLVFLVGISYKALLGEPAESNLRDPRTTIATYVGSMAGLLVAALISRYFSRKVGLLQNLLKESQMNRASIGCVLFGVIGASLINLLGSEGSKLNSAFTQLNQLIPLGIIIGVIYEIRHSRGTRSMNLAMAISIAYFFFFWGLMAFSKQGMLSPLVCWIVPVCALRYRLSKAQVAGVLFTAFIVFYYLVPYAQLGRRYATDDQTFSQRLELVERLLGDPERTRTEYKEGIEEVSSGDSYFNTPQGFWDRLTMISVDDGLISVTDQGRMFGYSPIVAGIINIAPHFIAPNKPTNNFGNQYAHEIGGLPDDDTTTGISFSPTAEAYHMGGWISILVVAPLVWSLAFIMLDSIFGNLQVTPWGLLVLISISHTAPEGAINGLIYFLSYGVEALAFCAFFASWVAPIIATAALGRERPAATPPTPLRQDLTPRER